MPSKEARLVECKREMRTDELSAILDSTVKYDSVNKVITFLAMLLAQTDEDQFNVAAQGWSTIGKSYLPLEISAYFPERERREYAGSSPTSFFHDVGEIVPISRVAKIVPGVFDAKEIADRSRRITLVDLEGKILIFIDQPSWQLMEKLRALLSHDRKILRFNITDRSGKGGLRSKTVVVKGYPVAIFCTASETADLQDRTRVLILIPETTPEKLLASLRLLAQRVGNRKKFRAWLQSHPERRQLMKRIKLIRATGIRDVIIPDTEAVLDRYLQRAGRLTPRTQRDFPRFLALIKGCALFNVFNRVRQDDHTILANGKDVDAAFALYDKVAEANELGLSTESWKVYSEILQPMFANGTCIHKQAVLTRFFQLYGRTLPSERLHRVILPELEAVGLVQQVPNPEDARESLIVSAKETEQTKESKEPPATDGEIEAATAWLRQRPFETAYYSEFTKNARLTVIEVMLEKKIIAVVYVQLPGPDARIIGIVYLVGNPQAT
jgi:hypothetical protein